MNTIEMCPNLTYVRNEEFLTQFFWRWGHGVNQNISQMEMMEGGGQYEAMDMLRWGQHRAMDMMEKGEGSIKMFRQSGHTTVIFSCA